MTTWAVELRFNGRLSGRQVLTTVVEATGIQEAITAASLEAIRDPKHGYAICHTGVTVEDVNDDNGSDLICEACNTVDVPICEGCDCCQECCNCTETDCDCDACHDRRANYDA